jgi:Fic family protein
MHLIEATSRIEPCLPDALEPSVVDLVASIASASERLGGKLHPQTALSLAELVRVMNCYYSNLIEGHNTRPREIEAALNADYARQEEKRNLQLEAVAHITVQRNIDALHIAGTLPEPTSATFIQWLHKSFYENLPEGMRIMEKQGKKMIIIPGMFRNAPKDDVTVGRHQPPSSDVVQAFMEHFQARYSLAAHGKGMGIAAIAAAHHRFNYIHPFIDGNGRVSRLMSHAMALHAGIGAHGLWSISRGLARGVESPLDYMRMMDFADMPRQGDLDGRGNLSLKALNTFIVWFLQICLDQITFMQSLFDLDALAGRLRIYCERQGWGVDAFTVLERALISGELPRGDITRITGKKERSARLLLSALTDHGILASSTPKGAVSLRFPVSAVETLFPNLFPGV